METKKDQTLKIILLNARSIVNKIPELQLLAFENSPDVILITESWTNSNITNAEINLVGYSVIRTDRPDYRGGGCLLYHKMSLHVTQIDTTMQTNRIQSLWATIKCDNTSYTAGLYDNSPSSSQDEQTLMMEEIRLVCKNNKNVLVCGDFNYPGINWTTLQADSNSQDFLDCTHDCFLSQLVTEPTRGENILDIVLTNIPTQISDVKVKCPLGSSDHNQISFSLVAPQIKKPWKTQCLDYRRGNYKKFRRYLCEIEWNPTQMVPNVENMWMLFKTTMQAGIDQYVPNRKILKRTRPMWYNQHVKNAIRIKRKKWDNYIKSRSSENYETYKKARNISNSTITQEKRKLEERISANIKYDPKAFFKYAKKKMNIKEDILNIHLDGGETTMDEREIAEAFNSFFVSTFTEENLSKLPPRTQNNLKLAHRDILITEKQVEQILEIPPTSASHALDECSSSKSEYVSCLSDPQRKLLMIPLHHLRYRRFRR